MGSIAGRLLVMVVGGRWGGRNIVPTGASRVVVRGVDFLGCWKGEDAGTSIMLLAGEEDLIDASMGF